MPNLDKKKGTESPFHWKYLLSDLSLGAEEEEAVLRVIRSKWLSMGPEVCAFEEEFKSFIGARHVLATSSCTTALHLALLALGLGPGDEVVVPAMTFVATANAVVYTGATPVFADIQAVDRPLICPADIERKITPKTRAIVVMHYAGYPCDMEAILRIAQPRGIRVVEDAAHSAGSAFHEQMCGTLGDVGCFSLFGNKNLPAGEGGILVTNDEEVAKRVRLQRSHGMTSLSWDRSRGHAAGYDVLELGYNYRMPELSAAVAREQLKKMAGHNGIRNQLFIHYVKSLSALAGVTIPFGRVVQDPGARHLMTILLPGGKERGSFMQALRRDGIQSSVHYPAVYSLSYYRARAEYQQLHLPNTDEFSARVVTLPFHPGLSESDVDQIAEGVKVALGDI